MMISFISLIVSIGKIELEDILFVLVLPCVGFLLAALHTEIDGQRIAKAFKIGHLWCWEFHAIRWDKVSDLKVYRTSRRGFVNLKLTTMGGKRMNYMVPEGSVGAARFEEIAQAWKV